MYPKESRIFGYIYDREDKKHHFWAFKTARSASETTLKLKELFEIAYELRVNSKNTKTLSTRYERVRTFYY